MSPNSLRNIILDHSVLYHDSMAFTISNSIQKSRENIQHIKSDKLGKSIGNIWSIKKLLVLEYYLPSFKKICSPKNNFHEWIYADPFCGSGLFHLKKDPDFKNEFYPGSALVGTITAINNGFNDCLLFDKSVAYVKDLNQRLSNLKHLFNNKKIQAQEMTFEKSVPLILSKRVPYKTAILVFVDPAGYVPIKWKLMEKLYNEVGIDVILNFYTHRIAQNVSASKKNKTHEKNLNEFFGDAGWQKFRSPLEKQNLGSKLLDYYITKIRTVSKKNVIEIGVFNRGMNKLYDLIVITRSKAGADVIRLAQDIMHNATTKAIKSEFKVQLKKQETLD